MEGSIYQYTVFVSEQCHEVAFFGLNFDQHNSGRFCHRCGRFVRMPAGATDEVKKVRMDNHAEEWCPLASRKTVEERRAKRRRLDILGGEELHYIPCMLFNFSL
ncbi:unnamed protein product [Gongylonema pulchrum]|uniref:Transcription factor n=1 Tax=Gongylonema pulchrum TaxID=637853 RepID=A0A183DT73_9BILA|nr:unnamed protein product [Gongylonema pulchrum]